MLFARARAAPARRAALRRAFSAMPEFKYADLFQSTKPLPYELRKVPCSDGSDSSALVSTMEVGGKKVLNVQPEALRLLAATAMTDIAHLLRPSHLQQLSNILKDKEATDNDRFVALQLLKNANVAAGRVLPGCQDTGTAIVQGKRGQYVWTDGEDEAALARGVFDTYTGTNLRYSQVAPLDMYSEANTKNNLPAQIELYAAPGAEYNFHFMAKGGGSANKTFLFQQTKAFLEEKIATLGTAACPPYHLAIVIGGLSAEMTLKTVKYASARYYDTLPTEGSTMGNAFRDVEFEKKVHELTQTMGIGAQFGGKYFCHDVRVVRLPRHGASCPVGIGVSCSADRQAVAKISEEGVFLEKLETEPAKYLPEVDVSGSGEAVKIDLNQPMDDILNILTQYPTKTLVSLSGTIVVARDIAHAKIQERLDSGEGMPQYLKDHAVYYAGPAKTPDGMASGSFGPTTAGRMDSYVDSFQAAGGSKVMLAKGNRSKAVTNACKKHGGFYLGSIGGPAAILAQDSIKKAALGPPLARPGTTPRGPHSVEVLEYPELGMEAIWKIEVEDFPAFIVVDDKGNDFFAKWSV